MKQFVRTRIAAGDTKSEIKDQLIAQFGKGVLAAPEQSGFDLLAWVLPIAGLARRRRGAHGARVAVDRGAPRTSSPLVE